MEYGVVYSCSIASSRVPHLPPRLTLVTRNRYHIIFTVPFLADILAMPTKPDIKAQFPSLAWRHLFGRGQGRSNSRHIVNSLIAWDSSFLYRSKVARSWSSRIELRVQRGQLIPYTRHSVEIYLETVGLTTHGACTAFIKKNSFPAASII